MRFVSVCLLLSLVACSEEKSACKRACSAACSKAKECLGGQGSCDAQCSDACEDGPHVVFGVDVDTCVAQIDAVSCDKLQSFSVPDVDACQGLLPAGAFGGSTGPVPDTAAEIHEGFTYSSTDPQVAIKSLAALICESRSRCTSYTLDCSTAGDDVSCETGIWSDPDCIVTVANSLFDENCFALPQDDISLLGSCVLSLDEVSCEVDQADLEFWSQNLSQLGRHGMHAMNSAFPHSAPSACEALRQSRSTCSWVYILPRLGFNVEVRGLF